MTRLAVVGVGLIGRRHVELIGRSAGCELASIVDPADRARELASDLGVPWFPSLADLTPRDRPDGFIVASPSPLHLEHALRCIDLDVPTLVEKPIATTIEDGIRITRAAAGRAVPLLVGHHRRHSPLLRAARQVVDSGILGRLVAVNGSATFRKPDAYFEEAPWRRQQGGGPLLINMIHEVDSLRYLCGEICSVHAQVSGSVRGFEVEDTVAIGLGFESGALGTFLLSDSSASALSWELTSGEDPRFPNVADEDCYVLAGDLGSIGVPTMRLRSYAETPSWWQPLETETVVVERRDPLAEQLAHFSAVVRGDATPLVTGEDGVQDMRVIEAIAESGRTGRQVRVPIP